jgi:hypothetical protein
MRNLKFTGLTQTLGQIAGSYRDFQSNFWVNLRIFRVDPANLTLRVGRARRHQDSTLDWARWREAWVCTAWLPLDDATAESGAMWMVPGAHRWGDACSAPAFLTSAAVAASTTLAEVARGFGRIVGSEIEAPTI